MPCSRRVLPLFCGRQTSDACLVWRAARSWTPGLALWWVCSPRRCTTKLFRRRRACVIPLIRHSSAALNIVHGQVPLVISASAITAALRCFSPPPEIALPEKPSIPVSSAPARPHAQSISPYKPFQHGVRSSRYQGVTAQAARAKCSAGGQVRWDRVAAEVQSSIVSVVSASGDWATGIVVGHHGMIATNAHLLVPRSGGAGSTQSACGARLQVTCTLSLRSRAFRCCEH